MKYIGPPIKGYYDNSNLCPECNGHGCRRCLDNDLGLREWGTVTFPLSLAVNNCTPPMIQQPYGYANHQPKEYINHKKLNP